MLSIAIIYEDNRIWIKFSPEKFRELLKNYYKKEKSIDKAMDKIVEDIKKETLNK